MDFIQLCIISFFWIGSLWAVAIFTASPRPSRISVEDKYNNVKNLSQNRLVFNKKTGYYEKIFDLDEDDIEVLN